MANNFYNIDGKRIQFTDEEQAAWEAEQATVVAAAPAKAVEKARRNRRLAYQEEADPLFFEEQAGEVDSGTWAAKRAEIKLRFPK
jgi:hypothetical protein